LRGSGRFTYLRPLVLSVVRVSIPFIAGQWSLRARSRRRSSESPSGFNPLHCGAVVASRTAPLTRRSPRSVSIPFIAGQWSLRNASPTLAAGGAGFNPLHCGAVVASWTRSEPGDSTTRSFQSPSLRGSGRFVCSGSTSGNTTSSFNPLHCGAVVASSGKLRHPSRQVSFNPLHCGAVVASARRHRHPSAAPRVSIPFIAGQWSLRSPKVRLVWGYPLFQSPSLRGSGRFQRMLASR